MLLLYNKVKVHTEIELMLKFADCSEKTAMLKVGDRVKLTYRKDFCPVTKTGMIKEISVRVNCKGEVQNELSPYLLMDFSEQYESNLERLSVNDIINFELILPSTLSHTVSLWTTNILLEDGMDAPCYGKIGDIYVAEESLDPDHSVFKKVSTTITDEDSGVKTTKTVLKKIYTLTEAESLVVEDPTQNTPEDCPVCPGN